MKEIYIGLMSGTSIDGIDAVAVEFEDGKSTIIQSHSVDYDEDTRNLLHSLCTSSDNEIEKAGNAKVKLSDYEAKAVNELLVKAKLSPSAVSAIGSHGQTIRHCPDKGFSIQLDDGARLSAQTGIDVVCDFRSADIAAGGSGAPLAQVFHQRQFGDDETVTMVLNLGGIANLTVIDKNKEHDILTAFDVGPANTLIDTATRLLLKKPFDKDGAIAAKGRVINELLLKYLSAPYFELEPPKSTGRETFNADFIKDELLFATLDGNYVNDLVATLTELTVVSCVNAIRKCLYTYKISEAKLIICGGGAYNRVLLSRMQTLLSKNNVRIFRADDLGVNSKLIEAHAFALFAYMFMHRIPLPLSGSTGAKYDTICGCLYPAVRL
ncbi:MAG: anhydro-N-acetylmuramic acid kinase [Succinivibrio sp.]